MSKKFETNIKNSFFVCATEQSGDNIGEKIINQLKIKNNLKLCIRTLMVFKSKIPQKNLKFIYLENAKNLRIQ